VTGSGDEFGTTAHPSAGYRDPEQPTALPCLTIVCHPDPTRIGERAFLFADRAQGLLARTAPDFSPPDRLLGQPLRDPFLSRKPILLISRGEDLRIARGECTTEITIDHTPLAKTQALSGEDLRRGVPIVLAGRIVLLLHMATPRVAPPDSAAAIIGESDAVHHLREELARVGDLKTPVLLRGPSGTGKELAARAIHALGGANRPFVAVNLGSIPPNLAATELFGAVKGAFTGADRHQTGFFRAADGGTLFLDEVGEASAEVQVMLLRALESGEIVPVGAQRPIRVQTRLIAATDADLEMMMARESFKTPLFHRLSGYAIKLPSLGERREDLGRLFVHFAREELAAIGESERLAPMDPYATSWLPAELMKDLLGYAWPGNIRQLRNVVRQLVIGNRGRPRLEMTGEVAHMLAQAPAPPARIGVPDRNAADIDDRELGAVLRAHDWDIKATAATLGIARGTVYARIKRSPELHTVADLSDDRIDAAVDAHEGDLEAAAEALEVSARALARHLSDRNKTP